MFNLEDIWTPLLNWPCGQVSANLSGNNCQFRIPGWTINHPALSSPSDGNGAPSASPPF